MTPVQILTIFVQGLQLVMQLTPAAVKFYEDMKEIFAAKPDASMEEIQAAIDEIVDRIKAQSEEIQKL
jgi:predicted metal-dependent enzyme (double-stranded beta helix superfamily)